MLSFYLYYYVFSNNEKWGIVLFKVIWEPTLFRFSRLATGEKQGYSLNLEVSLHFKTLSTYNEVLIDMSLKELFPISTLSDSLYSSGTVGSYRLYFLL